MNQRDAINGLIRMGGTYENVTDFVKYHTENIWVWKAFEECALSAIRGGRRKMGAKGLFEQLRWDQGGGFKQDLFTKQEFKLNNNYTALYARLFILKFPEHKDAFALKELKHAA